MLTSRAPRPDSGCSGTAAIRRPISRMPHRLAVLVAVAALPLTLLGADASRAAFPGANGRIAFDSNRRGLEHVFTINPDGTGETQVTFGAGNEETARISPDGARIVFNSDAGGNVNVYQVNIDGSGLTRCTTDPAVDGGAFWAPDSKTIGFVSYRDTGKPQVYKMDTCGAAVTRLTNDGASDINGSWSPDGAHIAFATDQTGNNEVFQMNADGTGQTNCSNASAYDGSPDYSPDGSEIAFQSGRDNPAQSGIYVMHGCGGAVRNVTAVIDPTNGSNQDGPTWSPDGTKIAFRNSASSTTPPFKSDIYYVDATDGSNPTRVTTNAGENVRANWGPVPGAPGVLRVALPAALGSIDPALATTAAERQLAAATCTRLVSLKAGSSGKPPVVVPDAAVAPPAVSADGRTYAFTIREGLAFSPPDGMETVTAATFANVIARDQAAAGSPGAALLQDVGGFVAAGMKLSITLNHPDDDFPRKLADPAFCAVPADAPPAPSSVPLASAGPYYVSSLAPLTALRNPDYRGPRIQGVDRMDYEVVAGPAAARARVQEGLADYAPIPGGDEVSPRVGCRTTPPLATLDLSAVCLLPAVPASAVSIGQDRTDVGPGAQTVKITSITPATIFADAGGPASAPLGGLPLAGIDIASTPLAGIGLGAMGLDGENLQSVGGIQLSTVRVTPPQWDQRLVGTPFEGHPLQSVTLADLFREAPSVVQGIKLSDVDLSATPLAGIPLAGIALGALPLAGIPLAGIGSTLENWCAAIEHALPGRCASAASLQNETLIGLALSGVPLAGIPLAGIPLAGINLESTPLAGIPLAGIVLAGTPLAGIDVAASPLAGIPLAGIPLAGIGPEASPLAGIQLAVLAGLELLDDVVDCTAFDCGGCTVSDCAGKTLGDAARAGAIRPDATLGKLGHSIDPYELGDLRTYGGLNLWPLAQFLPPSVTLGDVLMALVKSKDYPWEQVPVGDIDVQSASTDGGTVSYDAHFTAQGTAATESELVEVGLPSGFRYVPGSTTLLPAGGPASAGEPTVSGRMLTFRVNGAVPGTPYTIGLRAHSGLAVGSFATSVSVTQHGAAAATNASPPVSVNEAFEPNDDPAHATPIEPQTLYLSTILHAGDVDYFHFTAQAGARIRVTLGNSAADFDLALWRPPAGTGPSGPPLGSATVDDTGLDLNAGAHTLEPETPQDVPQIGRPLAGVSANRGTAPEEVDAVARTGGDYTLAVLGYNGAFSDQTYVLRVVVDNPTIPGCTERSLPRSGEGTPGTLPPCSSRP